MIKKRGTWIILIIALLLAAGGGYVAYTRGSVQTEESTGLTLETATVTQGNIIITADGSGELVPTVELELAFQTRGVLAEVLVDMDYYRHEEHIKNTLKTKGFTTYKPEKEAAMRKALQDHAKERTGEAETVQETLKLSDAIG